MPASMCPMPKVPSVGSFEPAAGAGRGGPGVERHTCTPHGSAALSALRAARAEGKAPPAWARQVADERLLPPVPPGLRARPEQNPRPALCCAHS